MASVRGLRAKRRLQGVAFLVVVAALLGLTVAVYNKALPWQSTDEVTLQADRAGNQLVVPADVKLEGVLVGRVSDVTTDGDFANMTLQIQPDKIDQIPANVVARILPKTLFGEKYVDLVIPDQASSEHLQPGDVIPQDRSKTAIELQTVFNDLVPLLHTLKPAELSVTLSNVAQALQGRGDQLGHNLELVNEYFTKFNPALPTFTHDLAALADVASTYADATPDLLAMLRNFSTNARTFTTKQDVYAQFLTGTSDFARTATTVFGDNADRLIKLAHVAAPVTHLYAQYSKVLECLPNGLAIYDRTRLEQAFGGGPFLHITLTPVGDRGRYTPAERPRYSELTDLKVPANCFGLPYGNHDLHPVNSRYPANYPSDNYGCGGYVGQQDPSCTIPQSGGAAAAEPTSRRGSGSGGKRAATAFDLPSVDTHGSVGSKQEQKFVSSLLGPMIGADSEKAAPGLQDLLLGPMLRGMAVSVS